MDNRGVLDAGCSMLDARCWGGGSETRLMIEREFQQAVAAVEVQFVADVQPMILNRLEADPQQISNFFARAIFGNQLQDPAFR